MSQSCLVFLAHQTISQCKFIELDLIKKGKEKWLRQLHKEQSVNVRSPNQSNESCIKSGNAGS